MAAITPGEPWNPECIWFKSARILLSGTGLWRSRGRILSQNPLNKLIKRWSYFFDDLRPGDGKKQRVADPDNRALSLRASLPKIKTHWI